MTHRWGRRVARAVLLAGTLQLAASGCGGHAQRPNCDRGFPSVGLWVAVVSRSTGAPICNATVTAADGAHQETLVPSGETIDGGLRCFYAGAFDRPGTYTVEAKVDGTSNTVIAEVNTDGACWPNHVATVSVTIAL